FGLFDEVSIYLFTVEYVLRLFAAGGDPAFRGKRTPALRQAVTPFALIDLAVIGPYWLHLLGIIDLDLRVLRALRLLRLLKLLRDFIPALQQFIRDNRGTTIRSKVYALLNETPTSGRLHSQIDLILVVFIILSVFAVILETVPSIHMPLAAAFTLFDDISVAVFSIEYLLRLYSSPEASPDESAMSQRRAWIVKPSSLVDLIAIAPWYLHLFFAGTVDLRFIRILRVLRVLKLTRYNTAMKTFSDVMRREQRAFFAAMFVTFLITILAGAIVYEVEHAVQPEKFDTMPRAMYWAVITLASVGYGDISPITPIGQAFTMVLALLGIGIVALPAGILGSAFSDQLHRQREDMIQKVEDALADGVITAEEARTLEEERIRLHLTIEQFDALKVRAMARRGLGGSISSVLTAASSELEAIQQRLHGLPIDAAVIELEKLQLTETQKAALRVLLK
ncbi:MAG: ion transporter, partial [Actinobacteria bacterium]|nr:ion transporter [Actinomycetota bacterium]